MNEKARYSSGDEINIHVPQTLEAQIEARTIASIKENVNSAQNCGSIFGIVQDGLLGSYRLTKGNVNIETGDFYQYIMAAKNPEKLIKRMKEVEEVMNEENKKKSNVDDPLLSLYTGRGLLSLIFPSTFNYNKKDTCIRAGVIISGTLDKSCLGAVPYSIQSLLHLEYGSDYSVDFIDNIQRLALAWIEDTSYSIGFEDSRPICDISQELNKLLIKADTMEREIQDPSLREMKVTSVLGSIKNRCQKIIVDKLPEDNKFRDHAASGSKGSFDNVTQMMGLLGQQHVLGSRVPLTISQGSRALPCFPFTFESGDINGSDTKSFDAIINKYKSRGFVTNCFYSGLDPVEQWFHSMAGREGVIDTAIRTSDSGYIQRKLILKMEGLVSAYDGTVRNTNGTIVKFLYGDDGFDGSRLTRCDGIETPCVLERLVDQMKLELNQKKEISFIDSLLMNSGPEETVNFGFEKKKDSWADYKDTEIDDEFINKKMEEMGFIEI